MNIYLQLMPTTDKEPARQCYGNPAFHNHGLYTVSSKHPHVRPTFILMMNGTDSDKAPSMFLFTNSCTRNRIRQNIIPQRTTSDSVNLTFNSSKSSIGQSNRSSSWI